MDASKVTGDGSYREGALAMIGTAEVIAFRRKATVGFSSRDLMVLSGWHIEGHALEIEAGRDGMPNFAAISADRAPWAIWGIVRQGATILVWNCISHADLGRFDSIEAALMALPLAAGALAAGAVAAGALAAPLPPRSDVIRLYPGR